MELIERRRSCRSQVRICEDELDILLYMFISNFSNFGCSGAKLAEAVSDRYTGYSYDHVDRELLL